MKQNIITKEIKMQGMSCSGCEIKIEKLLKDMDGILQVKANYKNSVLKVTYDSNKITLATMLETILPFGYQQEERNLNTQNKEKANILQLAILCILLLGVSILYRKFSGFSIFNSFPEAKVGMSYATIFIIGLLTSLHCVGMCGGICLSQCIQREKNSNTKFQSIKPSLLYNLGRIISYTLVGGIVGALGAVISFHGVMRGAVAIFAGVFMIIMGLNMLNIFPWLRRFSIKMPRFLTKSMEGKGNTPFYIGLLNGLMPCGPLQAMQLYALSTGSPMQGAISMFLFALGTSFLMFGFGALSGVISKKFTKNLLILSGIFVIVLGVGMLNTGLNMSGMMVLGTEVGDTIEFQPVLEDGYQIVTIQVASRSYEPIVVKKDIPVKFNLYVNKGSLNGCNDSIIIPEYGIKQNLQMGDNIVEFTPTEEGVYSYSCWMNMIRSSITVVE